ncbi:MAG: AMP-binding protein, partial [Nitrososphaera sp.]|nr:AMP-binding protein [Nitrososphaera sp.]
MKYDNDTKFNELIKKIQKDAIKSQPHHYFPLVEIQSLSILKQKLIDHIVAFQNFPTVQHLGEVFHNSGEKERRLKLEISKIETFVHTNYDFIIKVAVSERLVITFEFNRNVYEQELVRRIADNYNRVLDQILEKDDLVIHAITLLSEKEKRNLLHDFNDRRGAYPSEMTIHEAFEEQVEKIPDNVAVVYEEGELTYRTLNERANQLAEVLRSNGVGADSIVGLLMEPSLEMVVGLLGILKAGGAYVPLDPDYPRERLAFMLEDSRAPLLLTQSHLLDRLPHSTVDSTSHCPAILCLDTDWASLARARDDKPINEVTPDNLAYLIYTSGSTGRPKGVMISHAAICNHMYWMQSEFPLTPADRVLQKTPLGFDASVWEFYAPLLVGAALVLAKSGGHQDPSYLVRTIADYSITILQLVPSLLRLLVETPGFEKCFTFRNVFCGGEALTSELVARFFERLDAR